MKNGFNVGKGQRRANATIGGIVKSRNRSHDSPEETYTVRIIRDNETGHIVQEDWMDKNGEPHRIGGPAKQEFDYLTGQRTKASYWLHGWRHRPEEEGAQLQEWDAETGHLIHEEYVQNSKLNRSGGLPAMASYSPKTGKILKRQSVCAKNDIRYNPESGNPYDPMTGEELDSWPDWLLS